MLFLPFKVKKILRPKSKHYACAFCTQSLKGFWPSGKKYWKNVITGAQEMLMMCNVHPSVCPVQTCLKSNQRAFKEQSWHLESNKKTLSGNSKSNQGAFRQCHTVAA